jgi:hypothetical protein
MLVTYVIYKVFDYFSEKIAILFDSKDIVTDAWRVSLVGL